MAIYSNCAECWRGAAPFGVCAHPREELVVGHTSDVLDVIFMGERLQKREQHVYCNTFCITVCCNAVLLVML
jgi:hypothetical protein